MIAMGTPSGRDAIFAELIVLAWRKKKLPISEAQAGALALCAAETLATFRAIQPLPLERVATAVADLIRQRDIAGMRRAFELVEGGLDAIDPDAPLPAEERR